MRSSTSTPLNADYACLPCAPRAVDKDKYTARGWQGKYADERNAKKISSKEKERGGPRRVSKAVTVAVLTPRVFETPMQCRDSQRAARRAVPAPSSKGGEKRATERFLRKRVESEVYKAGEAEEVPVPAEEADTTKQSNQFAFCSCDASSAVLISSISAAASPPQVLLSLQHSSTVNVAAQSFFDLFLSAPLILPALASTMSGLTDGEDVERLERPGSWATSR